MSIFRMASFKASYALFLKLVSGTIRTIAISASAMVGGALVCFRVGMTNLLGGRRLIKTITELFLAYQMPGCQVTYDFNIYVSSKVRFWHTKCHSKLGGRNPVATDAVLCLP